MFELLPDTLSSGDYNIGTEQGVTRKPKHRDLSILEWVQAFTVYMAVLSWTAPRCTAALLQYQQRLIHAACNLQPGGWAAYDHQFRLKASATGSTNWSTIDLDTWNDAFLDQAMPLAPPSQRLQYSGRNNQSRTNLPAQQHICLDWNDDPNPDCPYPHCKFEHICYRCTVNPRILDNRHKAMFCPNRGKWPQCTPLLSQPRSQF